MYDLTRTKFFYFGDIFQVSRARRNLIRGRICSQSGKLTRSTLAEDFKSFLQKNTYPSRLCSHDPAQFLRIKGLFCRFPAPDWLHRSGGSYRHTRGSFLPQRHATSQKFCRRVMVILTYTTKNHSWQRVTRAHTAPSSTRSGWSKSSFRSTAANTNGGPCGRTCRRK